MIIEARYRHVRQMLDAGLRPADLQEIEAGTDLGVETVLVRSWLYSEKRWVLITDGHPCAMWGVAPWPTDKTVGSPWLLATPEFSNHKLTFIKNTKNFVTDMARSYSRLANFVDVRHSESIRWLKWAGFTVAVSPVQFGPKRMPFYPFHLEQ